ncbi:MAG: hypothetical protein FJ303_03650 [Planctomycetes bacterium]|nr:hypothetical protein [Planctomycetota bacterium]
MARSEVRTTRITWGIFYAFLYFYRCAYSVLGEVLVMRVTPISDTRAYQTGTFEQAEYWETFGVDSLTEWGQTILATGITAWIGSVFGRVFGGNPILINIGFQTIAFVGLVRLLSAVSGPKRKYAAALVLLPSFSLWTSIASKEAIVTMALTILSAYIVKMYDHRGRLGPMELFAAVVLYVFKAHYLAAIAYFWTVTVVGRFFRQRAAFALVAGLASLTVLYVVRDKVDRMADSVQTLILTGTNFGRSTRAELFFVDPYDVFWRAPEGMLRAFFGPSLEQVGLSPLHMIAFLESSVLIAVLGFLALRELPRLPAYSVIVASFVLFWIGFVNYPVGVMNPGSAIRYRSGWVILVIVVCATFLSRQVYIRWVQTSRARSSSRDKTPVLEHVSPGSPQILKPEHG